MKTLIITAHPSSQSFTKAIAETYKKSAKNAKIIDLYDPEYAQPFLHYEKIQETGSMDIPNRIKIQKEITKADELIFIFPLWWNHVPAILKNFFDLNFSTGFAFQFEKGKTMPKKLLTDKKAKIFFTYDAPIFVYWILGRAIHRGIKKSILEFCGIKVTEVVSFSSFRNASADQRKLWLKKVKKIAQK